MEQLQTPGTSQYTRRVSDSSQVETKKSKWDNKCPQLTIRKSERVRPKKLKLDVVGGEIHSHIKHEFAPAPPTFAVAPLILDSGGHTIKMGFTSDNEPKIIPNAIMKVKSEKKRLFIGNQIDECRDLSGLYFLLPSERGYITKWEVQKPIWDYAFNKGVSIEDRYLVMTQPIFNFKSIQDGLDEIFFEDYEVKAMYRANPTDFSKYEYCTNVSKSGETCIVVDSGFSFTHIVPYIDGKKYWKGVKRINLGGKFLTNYLRDIISYRMYDVMEETYVINQVKEDCVYVSMNVIDELKKAKLPPGQNPISINYVLPDFNMIRRGYIQNTNEKDEIAENCQILRLNNERFTVPELLFYPKDVGLSSIGVAEAVAKTILAAPAPVQHILAKHIILTGGNARIPGFKERLEADVRSFLPSSYILKTYKPQDPVTFAWQGGKSLTQDPQFKSMVVTKEEYEEHGSKLTYERFNTWTTIAEEEPEKPTETVPISYLDHLKKSNFWNKDDDAPPIAEEKNTFIDDPGEGPSSRCDPVPPSPESEGEGDEDRSSDNSEALSEGLEGSSRDSEVPTKKTKNLDKGQDQENGTSQSSIEDLIREVEYDALMECMKTYI